MLIFSVLLFLNFVFKSHFLFKFVVFYFFTLIFMKSLSMYNCSCFIFNISSLFWLFMVFILFYVSFFMNLNGFNFYFLCFMFISFFFFFFLDYIISFFFFFEISLILIFFLTGSWGYQYERLQASVFMLLYSLVSSLPLLVLSFFFVYSGLDVCVMLVFLDFKSFWSNFLIFVFLVKFPIYFGHLWLPKAHVESCTEGSIILAGVMLKMGFHGVMSFMCLFMYLNYYLLLLIVVVSIIGVIFSSVICYMNLDIKTLIAYSSVSHMCFSLSSFFVMTHLGYTSSYLSSLCHSFCSGGLFYMAGIIYLNFKTRNIMSISGLLLNSSSFSFMFVLFSFLNMSVPLSIMVFSEFMMVSSLSAFSFFMIFVLLFNFMLIGNYNLHMFMSVLMMDMVSLKIMSVNVNVCVKIFFFFMFMFFLFYMFHFLVW